MRVSKKKNQSSPFFYCLFPFIQHTSRRVEGQIYIPVVNYALLALCLTIVLAFRSSTGIADAYGIAVLLDMLLTTTLCTLVMISVWRAPVIVAAAFFAVFFTVEGVLWSSTLRKVVGYGWMAIIMAVMWGGIMAGEWMWWLVCVFD